MNTLTKSKRLKTIAVGALAFALIAPMLPMTAVAAVTGPDTIPPVVSLNAPANGSTVSGTVSITASSTDTRYNPSCPIRIYGQNFDVGPLTPTPAAGGHPISLVSSGGFVCGANNDALYFQGHGLSLSPRMDPYLMGVAKVEFYVDGALKGSTTTSPYAYAWDTTTATNGSHTIQAKSYDLANNVGTSTVFTVTVANGTSTATSTTATSTTATSTTATSTTTSTTTTDTTLPVITLTSPANNSFPTGQLVITSNVSDNVGVTKVELWINGALSASSTVAPYSFAWDLTQAYTGTYQLQTKAYDAVGNVGVSQIVTIKVTGKVYTGGNGNGNGNNGNGNGNNGNGNGNNGNGGSSNNGNHNGWEHQGDDEDEHHGQSHVEQRESHSESSHAVGQSHHEDEHEEEDD